MLRRFFQGHILSSSDAPLDLYQRQHYHLRSTALLYIREGLTSSGLSLELKLRLPPGWYFSSTYGNTQHLPTET